MDSELPVEPVIGPRDFARARWLGPGMTTRATHNHSFGSNPR